MLRKNAFLFSIDATLAVMVGASIMLLCLFFLSNTGHAAYNEHDLYLTALDSLAVLEKDGTLRDYAMTGDNASIQGYLDSLPDRICGNITIYSASSRPLYSNEKSGCASSDIPTMGIRVFFDDERTIYYTRMRVWYK